MTTDPGKKYNVGVVGYGLSAKVFHIPFIEQTPALALHSIVQRNPKPGDSAPDDHPDAKHFTSIERLVADADIDLVVISTPPQSHYAFVKLALEHGKHVLVEKPFVPTSAEARELAALAAQKQRVLCVYQNRRWDADFLTIRKLLQEDTLGRVYELETHFDRFRPEKPTTWKGKLTMDEGGGVVYDLGVHLLDQVYVLFGVPDSIFARFVNQRDGRFAAGLDSEDEPDSFMAVLSYDASGLLVQVKAGVLSVEKQQFRFWVRGAKGSYYKTGLDPQEDQLKAGLKVSDTTLGKEDPAWDGKLNLLDENGKPREVSRPNVEPETYLSLYNGLAKALASGKADDVPVPAAQAAEVLRIIEAVRESAKTGQNVKLS